MQPTMLEEKEEVIGGNHPDPTNDEAGLTQDMAEGPSETASREIRKASYKSVPDDWKTIPPGRFRTAVGHLEAVLLEISADGTLSSNLFDWKPTLPTLKAWADHLRAALKDLTK